MKLNYRKILGLILMGIPMGIMAIILLICITMLSISFATYFTNPSELSEEDRSLIGFFILTLIISTFGISFIVGLQLISPRDQQNELGE